MKTHNITTWTTWTTLLKAGANSRDTSSFWQKTQNEEKQSQQNNTENQKDDQHGPHQQTGTKRWSTRTPPTNRNKKMINTDPTNKQEVNYFNMIFCCFVLIYTYLVFDDCILFDSFIENNFFSEYYFWA